VQQILAVFEDAPGAATAALITLASQCGNQASDFQAGLAGHSLNHDASAHV
jgi:hypothetical protein